MAVNRRVPVVAPVERGCELAWRLHIVVTVQDVGDLARVLLVHAGEGKVGETLGRRGVEHRVTIGTGERQGGGGEQGKHGEL